MNTTSVSTLTTKVVACPAAGLVGVLPERSTVHVAKDTTHFAAHDAGGTPIVFAAGPNRLGNLHRDFLAPLAAAWPRQEGASTKRNADAASNSLPSTWHAPQALGAFMAELARCEDLLDDDGHARELAGTMVSRSMHGVVCAIMDEGTPTATIDFLAEVLRSRHVPALILCEHPGPWQDFERGGVMFESLTCSPHVLGAMLYSLQQRQQTIDELCGEVQLRRRCEGAIRGELGRVQEELQLAASVQREFTNAPLPRVQGLDAHALIRPVNFVNGDVTCVRDEGNGKVSFFLADAAGHGVPAALLTMVLIHALDTAEHRRGGNIRPADVIHELNARICVHCRGMGWFATAVYGVLDLHSRELRVAGAGHPPPVVIGGGSCYARANATLRAGGFVHSLSAVSGASRQGWQFRELTTQGPVLGLAEDAEFTEHVTILAPDETLLVYTDGLEGAFPDADPNETEMILRERPHLKQLRELSKTLAGVNRYATSEDDLLDLAVPAAQVAGLLTEMIDCQEGSLHQADDITAIILRGNALQVEMRAAA
jgi:sigma-B regulation protein RsbU (phosphoserine phosphatase)